MKKRILALCMLAAMLVGMLGMVGCQQSGPVAEPNFVVPEAGFNPDEPVTITFSHTMGANLQAVLETYIAEFNKIYPNITVEHLSAGNWGEINGTINTEIAGGTQPNIAYCYPDHVAMYNIAKAVVTLDNLIASDKAIAGTDEILGLTAEQKADFIESYYNEGLVYGDGLMYTMPLNKSTEVLYYNKTFFDEHNLTVPTTWDELWATCEKILEIDPNCYAPLGYDAEDNWFITLCEQLKTGYTNATGDQYVFDNDANKELMKELRGYYEKGYFTTQELYGSYTSNLFVESTPLDTDGFPKGDNIYMCVGSSGGASYQMSSKDSDLAAGSFGFEVGVAPIPQADAENKKVISQGPSLCILKGSDTTDQEIMASWLFVKFLCTNVDFQAEFSMTSGYMPVLKSVTENEVYAAWLAEANGYEKLIATCVKVGIEGRDNYFVSPAFNGSSTARVQVGALLLKCITGEISSGKTLDDLVNEAFQDAIDECEY